MSALLTEGPDLAYESTSVSVLRGVFSTPRFRPTEITDEAICDIRAYIAEPSKL